MKDHPSSCFGQRRIYYNNFAEHLLNAYNPNMTYPDLPYRWSDADWRACVDMVADFGFTVLEYWLVPRLFCREALESPVGLEFARQMNVVAEHAHRRGLQVEVLAGLATVGDAWHTYCPGVPEEWAEIRYLWREWTRRLTGTDLVGIFPGDPGACSRNGCTALTYIDRSCDIAALVRKSLPAAEIEFHTWGPPFFGWGNIQGPPGWKGEFIQKYQRTAWDFDKRRADEAMQHLLARLPDFPPATAVAINLGFNPDGNPVGEQDARPWAREIAKTNPILTWDFSLTEGENAILPHYRFERLFAQRRREREAAPYAGGICFTMTPLLNQLSLFESARSFQCPDADPGEVALEFFRRVWGPGAEAAAAFMPLFEIIPDWGSYVKHDISRETYHRRMGEFVALLKSLEGCLAPSVAFHPSPEAFRRELLFFALLFEELSGPAPDYDGLRARYWHRVYAIYDRLPRHVDPRPHSATDHLIRFFQDWRLAPPKVEMSPSGGWAGRPEDHHDE
jgi:hypothetical protein